MLNKIIKNKKGFTILEVIIAMSIVTMGLVGVLSLVQQNIQVETINRDYLIASNLAQETLEIVRNMRDENWLVNDGRSWDFQLYKADESNETSSTTFAVDYRGRDYEGVSNINYVPDNIDDPGAHLYFDSYNYYSHDNTGISTKFYRIVEINKKSDDCLLARSIVKWSERGRTHEYVAETLLYNWR